MGIPRFARSTIHPEEESRLILRCQNGDSTAFKILVEKYEKRAFWIAYHMVGHADDAQDVVQEAFIRVYRSINRFRLGKRFYTWFYQIVLHLSIDCLRKRRDEIQLDPETASALEASRSDPAESLLRDESSERVQEVLGSLPPRERAILILRDIEDFSAKEIADIIRSNHSTVRWWLFLARKQFRAAWESRFGKEDLCV
jgi:RNA polymerase sigma-70 factor (ECF subfamily)